MTRQEYRDLLISTSASGGFPSYGVLPEDADNSDGGSGTGCLYRGPGGKRCAAGLLISDAAYSPRFEGQTAHALIQRGMVEVPIGMTASLLSQVQAAHDRLAEDDKGEAIEKWDHEAFVRSVDLILPPVPPAE